ncbi:PAS fold, partial [Streptomyces sp. DvalAA-14]|uniref:PAS domain-containing protein n=1 Tax=unclassified Streptomyces TaxID=2593676 RepID=UPI00081B8544
MINPDEVLIGRGPGDDEPVGAALAVIDAEGTVTGWTTDAQRLLGYRAAETVGRPAVALLAA